MLNIDLQLKKGNFHLHVVERLDNPGFTVIQGRSGCGKTTLLRCIAGLEPGVRGRLTVAGTHWQGPTVTLPPHRRSLGYVPQEPTLFPHKSVRDNLLFGFNRLKPRDRKLEFDHLVALLELAPLLERQPDQLSGGQKQRVAMGRALLTSPQLLLMDEPLASLDQQSKSEILPYLDRLTATLSIPVIYVTHSSQESARLADTLWIMDNGKVVRRGPAKRLLTALESEDSHRADACARIDGRVLRHQGDYGLTWVEVGVEGQELAVPHLRHEVGDRVALQIDARDVSIALSRARDSSIVNLLDARIEGLTVDRDSAYTIVRLAVGSEVLLARITSFSARRLDLNCGMHVIAQVKAVTL